MNIGGLSCWEPSLNIVNTEKAAQLRVRKPMPGFRPRYRGEYRQQNIFLMYEGLEGVGYEFALAATNHSQSPDELISELQNRIQSIIAGGTLTQRKLNFIIYNTEKDLLEDYLALAFATVRNGEDLQLYQFLQAQIHIDGLSAGRKIRDVLDRFGLQCPWG